MKKLLLSVVFMAFGFNGMAENTVSLEQLKEICHRNRQNSQIAPFTSSFSCSEHRTFHREVGEARFNYSTENKLAFRASFKDGAHGTEWTPAETISECHEAKCSVIEKWRATARYTVSIKSCEELDGITTEQEYCQQALAPIWEQCQREMTDNSFNFSQGGQCEYTNLGERRSCVDQNQQQQQQQRNNTSSESSSQSSSDNGKAAYNKTSTSDTSHTSSSDVRDQKCNVKGNADSSSDDSSLSSSDITDHLIGRASFKLVTVKRGTMHNSHKVVELTSDPSQDSLLYKLGMRRGHQVSKVSSVRTKTVNDLIKALDKASNRKNISFDSRPSTSDSFKKKTIVNKK